MLWGSFIWGTLRILLSVGKRRRNRRKKCGGMPDTRAKEEERVRRLFTGILEVAQLMSYDAAH